MSRWQWWLQHNATHCNKLQNTPAHYSNTLQHATTRCSTLYVYNLRDRAMPRWQWSNPSNSTAAAKNCTIHMWKFVFFQFTYESTFSQYSHENVFSKLHDMHIRIWSRTCIHIRIHISRYMYTYILAKENTLIWSNPHNPTSVAKMYIRACACFESSF